MKEQKNIEDYTTEELKIIAFEAYQNRELANQQITQANQTIVQVNQELNKRGNQETNNKPKGKAASSN